MKKLAFSIILFSLFFISCVSNSAIDSKSMQALQELGVLYLDNGEYEMALYSFDRALAIDGNNSEVLYNKILTLLADKQFEKALELSENSFKAFPAHLRFLKTKASALIGLKKMDDAVNIYEYILQLDPGDYVLHASVMEFAYDNAFYTVAQKEAEFLMKRKEQEDRALTILAKLQGKESPAVLIQEYLSKLKTIEKQSPPPQQSESKTVDEPS
ncbi:tetratricopeptide repeat protein [uncultured Sphaerochaeta sp.]|uniref:tetratricopeptide repeat protein n=1 Tax=uncultured Sphaerochaeta sp. TaxID=886478 RepID=UPI002A0A4F83|nr:tetratricopeptide repeat protein [uncultured Sphaerochaeta sp.]